MTMENTHSSHLHLISVIKNKDVFVNREEVAHTILVTFWYI